MRRHRLPLAVAGAGVAGLIAVQGCSSSAHKPPPPSPSPTGQAANPLDNSGTAGNLLAVKIDNVGRNIQQIQHGLGQADIVYWVQVEGGLSRFLAVYDANHLPDKIGPVRSARQTDIPLLQQYGRLDFAYSGAISGLIPLLDHADLQTVTPSTTPVRSATAPWTPPSSIRTRSSPSTRPCPPVPRASRSAPHRAAAPRSPT